MRLRATVTPTVGALRPFGKARFTSPAIDNASASGGRWRQTESSTQLVRIAGLRLGQRVAANAIDRGADLVGRALCRRRLVLDYLHCMTVRRIHAEQGCTPLR